MVIATVEWKVKYFCADTLLYFAPFIKREKVEPKPAENKPVWWKATKLWKWSNSTESDQIRRNWDQNMLLTEPLASRSGCGQDESLCHQGPDGFQQLWEIKTGALRVPGFDGLGGGDPCPCWAGVRRWSPHQKWRVHSRMGCPCALSAANSGCLSSTSQLSVGQK